MFGQMAAVEAVCTPASGKGTLEAESGHYPRLWLPFPPGPPLSSLQNREIHSPSPAHTAEVRKSGGVTKIGVQLTPGEPGAWLFPSGSQAWDQENGPCSSEMAAF